MPSLPNVSESELRAILEKLPADKLMSMCPRPIEQLTEITANARQREFLALQCEEAFYGGAAGGSKTVAMLLWLKEGINVKDYSGLFLRRTYAQLEGSPTSPIDFSHNVFGGLGQWDGSRKRWLFPSGAVIRFGHMQHEVDKLNYQGPSFHRICFDETPQFSETQYTYMFSRLRRTVGFPIACGIRAAGNPANNWARRRFVSDEAIRELKKFTAYDPSPPGMMFDCPGTDGVFVPARVADNPAIETEEYIDRMRKRLPAHLAAQLANGDWSVIEGAVIDPANIRYYRMRGAQIAIEGAVRDSRGLTRFATIDTAGTSKQKAAESKGKDPSFSVCAIWEHWPEVGLFLRFVWRKRASWAELKEGVDETLRSWGHPRAIIENAHHGPVLASELQNTELVNPNLPGMGAVRQQAGKGSDTAADSAKYDRAVASGLLNLIEAGQFYLPEVGSVPGAASWMPELEAELFAFTGRPDEAADQVDVCSYAANRIKSSRGRWGGVIDARAIRGKRYG